MPKKTGKPKSKKRTLPECISQTAQGGYRVRVTYRPPGGVRLDRVRTLPPGSSLGQAVDLRDALKAELVSQAGAEAEESEKVPTLADFCERWIEERAAGSNGRRPCKSSSLRNQISYLDRHILPEIGQIPVDELRRADIVNLCENLESKVRAGTIAARTARTIWNISRSLVIDACVEFGLQDPGQRTRRPYLGRLAPAGRSLTEEEIRAFVEAVVQMPLADRAMMLLLLTGMRRCEIISQRIEDLRLEEEQPYLVVSYSKTEAGQGRWVPLLPLCAQVLRLYVEQLERSTGWLWVGQDGVRHTSKYAYQRRVQWALGAAKISATGHDFRRTFITMADRQGVRNSVVRDVVGHVDARTTAGYMRLSEEDRAEVLVPMLRILKGGKAS